FLDAEKLVQKGEYVTYVIFYDASFERESNWGDYTGVELGPKQIRASSARYSGYLPEVDHIDVKEHLSFGDAGDVPFVAHDNDQSYQNIEDFANELWITGKFLVGFGGEHGVTYPILKALADSGKTVGMIDIHPHYHKMTKYNEEKCSRNT